MPKAKSKRVTRTVLTTRLSDTDITRLEEITGEKYTSLATALDQWDRERDALGELNDENQALLILNKRLTNIVNLSKALIDGLWADSALLFTPKTRAKVDQFQSEYEKTKAARVQSKEIQADHKIEP